MDIHLTPSQKQLLGIIRDNGGRLASNDERAKQLHRRTRFEAAKRLQDAGLVVVRRGLRDARTAIYMLTERGRQVPA